METVTLKNGTEEAAPLVAVTMLSLHTLAETLPGFLAIYDLAKMCKGGSPVSGQAKDLLINKSLLQPDGRVHQSIKNVVLSAVEGEMLETRLVSPYAETKDG